MDSGGAKTEEERVFGAPGILGWPIIVRPPPDALARDKSPPMPHQHGSASSVSVRFQLCCIEQIATSRTRTDCLEVITIQDVWENPISLNFT